MKIITKTNPGQFSVETLGEPFTHRDGTIDLHFNSTFLQLDFNPIIEMLTEREKSFEYCLIHWQAQPKGEREWGVYDPQEDTYKSSVFERHQAAYGAMKMKMLDDATAKSLPSSVIYFAGYLPLDNDPNISTSIQPTPEPET